MKVKLSGIAEKISLLVIDILGFNLSFLIAYWVAFESGISGQHKFIPLEEYFLPTVLITCYWLFLFLFFGLYISWRAHSRFDELISIAKAVTFGGALLFILTFDFSNPLPKTRIVLLSYWFSLILLVGSGRIAIRSFQRYLLRKGIGARRTIIVGGGMRGKQLLGEVRKYPALGYRPVGFVCKNPLKEKTVSGKLPVLGTIKQLSEIIRDYKIEDVLIALPSGSHEDVLKIISHCNTYAVNLYILPDLYDIVSGQARTNQIYGIPLIEIAPELMPSWEKKVKRLIDILTAVSVLTGFLPFYWIVAIIIKIDSKGPVLFNQRRVGKNGREFTIYKFRSMIAGAEEFSGPTWAKKDDPRITRAGKFLRKMRIDEIPQFWNILKGEMSLVGPRPERPFFVEKFKKEIPLYTRRLTVKPGLTGWAQVKLQYNTSMEKFEEKLEYEKNKLKYDIYYTENISLRMDAKILLRTIWIVLTGKGGR